jgi:hypothetical protein
MMLLTTYTAVMAGLVPAIHVLLYEQMSEGVDARHHRQAKRRRPSDVYGRA